MIPKGIEVLVKKASVDPAFRKLLLEKRSQAADEIGLKLSPTEVSMLTAIPAAQLEAVIASTKVEPRHVAEFMGKVAAVMLAALAVGAGIAVTSSIGGVRADVGTQGIRPDPNREIRNVSRDANSPTTAPSTQPAPPPPTRGTRPDAPPPVTKGIRP